MEIANQTLQRIVVMTGISPLAGRAARVLYHAFPEAIFIVEDRPPVGTILRRRIRRHGLLTAFGQVAFRWFLARKARRQSDRIDAIWHAARLPEAPLPPDRVRRAAELNDPATHSFLQQVRPVVVIIFAVSKLTPETLQACGAPVLNLHPGITPAYRGVNSGYWALRNGDPERFGATVHLVDHGLDTGAIVEQIFCRPEPGDTIVTHNHRLVVAGLGSLVRRAQEVVDGKALASKAGYAVAPLFHEPTLWGYIIDGIRKGVW